MSVENLALITTVCIKYDGTIIIGDIFITESFFPYSIA